MDDLMHAPTPQPQYANGTDEYLVGALVSGRFEFATLSRNGRNVIVTAPPPARDFLVNFTDDDGRRLGAVLASDKDDALLRANAYLDQPVDEYGNWGPGQRWVYGESYDGLTFVPELILIMHIEYLGIVRGANTVGTARRLIEDGYDLPEPDADAEDDDPYSINNYDDQPIRIDQLGVEEWSDERVEEFIEYQDPMGEVPRMFVPFHREAEFLAALADFGYPNVRRDDALVREAL